MKTSAKIFILILLTTCANIRSNNCLTADRHCTEMELRDSLEPEATHSKILRLEKTYNFYDYKVAVYKGTLAAPDFSGNPFANDKEYIDFIKKGCRDNPVNFGGHYTIISKTCGAECTGIFIVDRITGKIFTDIKPNDGRYGYAFISDSELLIANASLFIRDNYIEYLNYWCVPEFYKWGGRDFSFLR